MRGPHPVTALIVGHGAKDLVDGHNRKPGTTPTGSSPWTIPKAAPSPDPNGGVQIVGPVPANRLIAEIDDSGDPAKTATAVAIVRAHDMKPQPVARAFDTAINDGINIYMRDVVRKLGFISKEDYAKLRGHDLIQLKYRIAAELAQQWAKMPLILETGDDRDP